MLMNEKYMRKTLNIKSFFVKYNDPIYIKLEKLEIISQLADEDNIESVLYELKEYSNEIDVDFVRKAVRTISKVSLKLPNSADKCVYVLVELMKNKVN